MNAWLSFLSSEHAQLRDSTIQSFGERPEDYSNLMSQGTMIPLTDRGVIKITGIDTDKLLQGQLTCDMKQLELQSALPGALCDTKGRMISNFIATRTEPETVLLVMAKPLLETTLATLKKYAVFYKTTLTDNTDDYAFIGITGDIPTASGFITLTITPRQHLLMIPADQAQNSWASLATSHKPVGEPFWDYLNIVHGIGEVRPQTREEFIPQMLNLQHLGGISFRKGCYTGQEIIARMQYLGKLKRRMYRLRTQANTLFQPGTSIHSEEKTNQGTLVMAQWCGIDTQEVLAVLTADAAAANTLIIGDAPCSIEILGLPYDEKFSGEQN
jgi:folate-binding protein YgfZ